MSPIQSNIDALRKSFVWSGRATRGEFWWFLAGVLVLETVLLLVAAAISSSARTLQIVPYALMLLVLPALMSAVARRLHDVGWSAWWQFLPLFFQLPIPVVLILTPSPEDPTYRAYSDFVSAAYASTAVGGFLMFALLVVLALPSQSADNDYGPRRAL